MKKVILISVIFLVVVACRKVELAPSPAPINLGVKAQSTAIRTIKIINNVVTAEFATTVGAKYSVQIVPFGSDEPVKKEGFTATDTVTKKIYNLVELAKKDYDLIFIDIAGTEVKYPVIIK